MRVIRTAVLSLLFIAGVFLASANVHDVSLVFLPNIPIAGWPEFRSVELPLFILVLGFLVLGVILGGFGALFEHVRLRRALRRASKEKDKLAGELGAARAEVEQAESQQSRLREELEQARAEASRLASEVPASGGTGGAGDAVQVDSSDETALPSSSQD